MNYAGALSASTCDVHRRCTSTAFLFRRCDPFFRVFQVYGVCARRIAPRRRWGVNRVHRRKSAGCWLARGRCLPAPASPPLNVARRSTEILVLLMFWCTGARRMYLTGNKYPVVRVAFLCAAFILFYFYRAPFVRGSVFQVSPRR